MATDVDVQMARVKVSHKSVERDCYDMGHCIGAIISVQCIGVILIGTTTSVSSVHLCSFIVYVPPHTML